MPPETEYSGFIEEIANVLYWNQRPFAPVRIIYVGVGLDIS
jgi:hypothetical protein